MSLGILNDGGPNEDSLAGSEWEREEERRDEGRHLAKLLLLLDFMFGQLAPISIPLIPLLRSAFPEIALEISHSRHWQPRPTNKVYSSFWSALGAKGACV